MQFPYINSTNLTSTIQKLIKVDTTKLTEKLTNENVTLDELRHECTNYDILSSSQEFFELSQAVDMESIAAEDLLHTLLKVYVNESVARRILTRRNQDLLKFQDKASSHDERISALEDDSMLLKARIRRLELNATHSSSRISELETETEQLKESSLEYCERIETLEAHNAKLTQDYDDALVEIDVLQERIDRLEALLLDSETENGLLKARIIELEALLEEQAVKIEEQAVKIEEQAVKIEEQAVKIEEQAVKIEEQAVKIEEQAVKIEEQAVKINNLAGEVEVLKQENIVLRDENGQLAAQINKLVTDIRSLVREEVASALANERSFDHTVVAQEVHSEEEAKAQITRCVPVLRNAVVTGLALQHESPDLLPVWLNACTALYHYYKYLSQWVSVEFELRMLEQLTTVRY